MPALSLVLAVHGEQGFLEQLLSSFEEQDAADVELVAIDDASPGHAPAMLDALAERDPRARVRHLAESAGRGAARNLGLELAEGRHVWFVDATGLLAPGSLAAVLDRLRDDDPDVLVVGHTRVDRLGRERAAAPPASGAALSAVAPRSFDKVLRREHLAALGLRFGDGAHGELPVTWPALLSAQRVATLPDPVYVHREPPNAARHGAPADVFAQYDAIFAFVEAHPDVADERRRQVLPAMVAHEIALLGGLPEHERPEFFARMAGAVRQHRRGDEPPPSGRLARVRARLVARGDYATWRRLEAALRARRAAARPRAALARRWRRARRRPTELQRWYRERLEEPVDPDLAVFAAYWYRGYSCNPRAIYEKARELVPGFKGVWIVKDEAAAAAMPTGVEHVVAGTREYFDVIARARWFVNNVNFPNHLVKRDGTTHVMTHHGTPLKKMGIDLQPGPGRERMNLAALLRRCARWDYSVSSNRLSTLVWERAYPVPFETLEVGYPRNDALATASGEDVRRIREELGIRPDQTAVLYAPTHREYEDGYVAVLDLAALADGLGPDHVVLARLHYFHEAGADPLLLELHREGRVLDVAGHPSIEELCLAADVLVTDYSSIMFDYGVLDRPIVIHAPDWEIYREMRGTYFDLMAEPPGVVTRTEAEVVEALRSGAAAGPEAGALRAAFRERFCALDDGHAAERVVRRVWLGEREDAVRAPARVAR